MIEEVRAFVTEVDDEGVSRFRSTDLIEPVVVRTPVGDWTKERTAKLWQVWGTSDGVPQFRDATEPRFERPYGPGGTRFSVFSLPPDSSFTDIVDGAPAASGDHLGIAATHAGEEEDAAFHATSTIDYIFVAEGEVEVELDEGKRELLTQGSVLVQRGTRHAWRNVSTQPVVLVSVAVGVDGGL